MEIRIKLLDMSIIQRTLLAAFVSITLTLSAGCQTISTKTNQNKTHTPSYLVYEFGLHLQGEQHFDPSWLDTQAFTERVKRSYKEMNGILEVPHLDRVMNKAMIETIARLYSNTNPECFQIDASFEDSLVNAQLECTVGEGFVIFELLIDTKDNAHKLIDFKSISNGAWMSEILAAVFADRAGFAKIKASYDLIKQARNGKLDYSKYYSLNGYIKTNRMLGISFNSANTDPKLREEISIALQQLCPTDPACAISTLDYYFETEQHTKAIEVLEVARKGYPRSEFINHSLAILYLRTNNHKSAIQSAKNLIWARPSVAQGYIQLFKASSVSENYDLAIFAAAALIKGFNVKPENITNSYSKLIANKPDFWSDVQAAIDESK